MSLCTGWPFAISSYGYFFQSFSLLIWQNLGRILAQIHRCFQNLGVPLVIFDYDFHFKNYKVMLDLEMVMVL